MSAEKKRTPKQTTGGGGDSIFDGAPAPVNNMASVSSGPYAEDLPVAGLTVGEVRKRFARQMDIAPKAQAVINGINVGDDVVLKAGENLQFIMHAGEKGADKVIIEGTQAKVTLDDGTESKMPLADLLPRIGPALTTGPVILPAGVRSVLSQGPITIWVWEKPPHIAQLSWIRSDSPAPYGGNATYCKVRIALPYLIILAVFRRDSNGLPELLLKDECFFRNEPLKSLEDTLHFPGLLNCSKFRSTDKKYPLSWICTQHIKTSDKMHSGNINDRFQYSFEAVRYCLLETSFNLSSEHHEGNSWYGASKGIDPRIQTIGAWEEATKKNPLFALEVPWISTKHTVTQVAQRIFDTHAGGEGVVKTSDDLSRIIVNG